MMAEKKNPSGPALAYINVHRFLKNVISATKKKIDSQIEWMKMLAYFGIIITSINSRYEDGNGYCEIPTPYHDYGYAVCS